MNEVVTQSLTGTIVRTLEAAGYGFIHADCDTTDIFIHKSRLRGAWPPPFGSRVRFKLEKTSRGLRALGAEIIPPIG